MTNPFRFIGPVEGQYYTPRFEFEKKLSHLLENQTHIVLTGPAKSGKTSCALHLAKTLEKKGFICPFIDIGNITSHDDFLQQVLRVLKARKGWMQSLIEVFPRLCPTMSAKVDTNTGRPSFGLSFDRTSDKDVKETIQDVLESLEKLGDKVVLIIDRCQKMITLDDKGWLEATLRMQRLKNTSFLFIDKEPGLFSDWCHMLELPAFGEEFSAWLALRCEEADVYFESGALEYLMDLVGNEPCRAQMLCFYLAASGHKLARKEHIGAVFASTAPELFHP